MAPTKKKTSVKRKTPVKRKSPTKRKSSSKSKGLTRTQKIALASALGLGVGAAGGGAYMYRDKLLRALGLRKDAPNTKQFGPEAKPSSIAFGPHRPQSFANLFRYNKPTPSQARAANPYQ